MTNSNTLSNGTGQVSNIVAILEAYNHSYVEWSKTLDAFSRAEEAYFAAMKQGADTQEAGAVRLTAEAAKDKAFIQVSKCLAQLASTPARNSEEAVSKLQAFMLWRGDEGFELMDTAEPEDRLAFSVLGDFANLMSPKAPREAPQGGDSAFGILP